MASTKTCNHRMHKKDIRDNGMLFLRCTNCYAYVDSEIYKVIMSSEEQYTKSYREVAEKVLRNPFI